MDINRIRDPIIRREFEYLAQVKNFFVDTWDSIFNFFDSYRWKEIVFGIKVAAFFISLLFLILIIFLLMKMNMGASLQKFFSRKDKTILFPSRKKIEKKWKKIEKKILGPEASCKLAVLEADSLFEGILKSCGQAAEIRISDMGAIRRGKSIKSRIVEDRSFKLEKEEARNIIQSYKKGLEELGLL